MLVFHANGPMLCLGGITFLIAVIIAITGRTAASKLQHRFRFAFGVMLAALGTWEASGSVYVNAAMGEPAINLNFALQIIMWGAGCVMFIALVLVIRYAGLMKQVGEQVFIDR